MKLAFELNLPAGAVDDRSHPELVQAIKEQAALNLDSGNPITISEAAEMLGLTRIQLLELLCTSGIGFLAGLDEEDFRQIRRCRDKHSR